MPAAQYLIRELPVTERPRERLLGSGSGSLSDAELVAVLLRTGRVGCSALQMATELLKEAGGLSGLLRLSPPALRRAGLGPAKVAALAAALEIGRRLTRPELGERLPVREIEPVARYLALRYLSPDQEIMGALFLDSRRRLLGERELYRGTLDRALVEPREVLKECLLRGAAAVVLFHTHPSGDPSPSAEDLLFTQRLQRATEVVGVTLVDHLVLGRMGSYVSLLGQGAW
ncbi:MAG TPA: DNA repair protein RadC [Thermoanaerobaculia bacterium]|nr:DNA repair protein RadC [Thermoanaerobaculia bacterium]